MENLETSARFEFPCRNLRCKEMFQQSPEDDAFAGGVYWCGQTQEAFGPDGKPAAKRECCEGRACYLR